MSYLESTHDGMQVSHNPSVSFFGQVENTKRQNFKQRQKETLLVLHNQRNRSNSLLQKSIAIVQTPRQSQHPLANPQSQSFALRHL